MTPTTGGSLGNVTESEIVVRGVPFGTASVQLGGSGGFDAGVPSIDAGSPVIDAGSPVIDAGRPIPQIDAGPPDARPPVTAEERVRFVHDAPPGRLARPLHVDTVMITYVLPAVGDDPGGVFVQSELTGPALFLAIDPATLGTPRAGGYGGFSVTETAIVNGQRRVVGILPGSFFSSAPIEGGVLAEPQELRSVNVPAQLDALESEITVDEMQMVSDLVACGRDHFCASITTAGMPGPSASYRLRVTHSVADAYGLDRRCYMEIGPTPMWRTNGEAQPSAWRASDVTSIACPPFGIASAVATSATNVEVAFDAPLDRSSISPSDFVVQGATVSSAVWAGSIVTLTTSAMAPGSAHLVTISNVRDVTGGAISLGASSIEIVAPSGNAPTRPGQVVITELMTQATDGAAGEWIELYNPSSTVAMQLSGCAVQVGASSFTLPSLSVAPRDHVVLGRTPASYVDVSYGGTLDLSPTASSVWLRCGSTVIDRVDYTTSFQEHATRSMSLDPDYRAESLNDSAINWCNGVAAYRGSDRGSPGAANPHCP